MVREMCLVIRNAPLGWNRKELFFYPVESVRKTEVHPSTNTALLRFKIKVNVNTSVVIAHTVGVVVLYANVE